MGNWAPEWAGDTSTGQYEMATDETGSKGILRRTQKRGGTCSDAMTPRQEGCVPVVVAVPHFGGGANEHYLT